MAPPLPTKVDNKTDVGGKDRPRTTQQQQTVIYKDKAPGPTVKLNDVLTGKDLFTALGEPPLLSAWRGSLVRSNESRCTIASLAEFTIIVINLPAEVFISFVAESRRSYVFYRTRLGRS